jgi:hypothetical protein
MTICMLIQYSSPWDPKGEEQEPFCHCFDGLIRRLARQISHCWTGSTTTLFTGLKSICLGRALSLQQHFALFIQTLNFGIWPRKQHITLAATQLGNHHNKNSCTLHSILDATAKNVTIRECWKLYSTAEYTGHKLGSINGLKLKAQNGCCRKLANARVPQVQDKVITSLV